eukprot:6837542-Prymnesium_polylepis.1
MERNGPLRAPSFRWSTRPVRSTPSMGSDQVYRRESEYLVDEGSGDACGCVRLLLTELAAA